jgi:diaminohydroxyphosphoribosylaminopyrimidine deaminase/5-amino-6-(5-phosphoribosylamino)uracil reductase
MLQQNLVREILLFALAQAKTRRGFCAPNPAVGAVLVNHAQEIIASGFHWAAGHPHAEIEVLTKISSIPSDATLYVTLEPCCHYGRTPPCTEAIIQSGIKQVVYAYRDPNPVVAGKGENILNDAGISCIYFSIPEIDIFYQSYTYWQKTKLPFVTAKMALTLDGKIAGKNSEPITITGETINRHTHYQRKKHDAILTTSKTIIADNPQLNARIDSEVIAKPIYILDSDLSLTPNVKIFKTAKTITLFHKADIAEMNKQKFLESGVRCVGVEHDSNGLNLHQILQQIGQDGIHDLWIEAGGKCFSSFLNQKLLQRALIYIAPHTKAEGKSAFPMGTENNFSARTIRWEQFGRDVLCEMNW